MGDIIVLGLEEGFEPPCHNTSLIQIYMDKYQDIYLDIVYSKKSKNDLINDTINDTIKMQGDYNGKT